MVNHLFVYGSLMHPNEIESLFGDNISCRKSKLNGYVRDFSKSAHSWGGKEDVGVLGLIERKDYWCNGLIITGLTDSQMSDYYARETGMTPAEYDEQKSGYKIVEVSPNKFEYYDENLAPLDNSVSTALINSRLSKPNTHDKYRDLCHDAARNYGTQFYQDFQKTTYEFFKNS